MNEIELITVYAADTSWGDLDVNIVLQKGEEIFTVSYLSEEFLSLINEKIAEELDKLEETASSQEVDL